jgi:alkylhydroperoxidase family enzyme
VEAVGGNDGKLPEEVRRQLLDGEVPAGALGTLAAQVLENALTVDDALFDRLRAAGISEDQLFECVAAAAVGAGLQRLRRGLALLG